MVDGQHNMTDGAAILPVGGEARPAAFLDRDGVINVDGGYIFRPDDLVFTPTAVEGIRLLNQAGYLVLVVTNQSGVARGLYEEDDIRQFHDHLQEQLGRKGAHVNAFYHCAYHPDGSVAAFSMDHEDRKPNPGMLRRAIGDFAIRLEDSFLIGDKESDVAAAERIGIPGIRVEANTCDLAATVRGLLTEKNRRENAE